MWKSVAVQPREDLEHLEGANRKFQCKPGRKAALGESQKGMGAGWETGLEAILPLDYVRLWLPPPHYTAVRERPFRKHR